MNNQKNKFGTLKVKILHNLTEAYTNNDKQTVKEILSLIKENKEFRELYLFYDEIENMYIEDRDTAKVYVESIEELLKEKIKKVSKYCENFNKKLKLENLYNVELYENLDIITEDDNLKNIDKKILGKKKLIQHLTTKKKLIESPNDYTNNENLLHIVLTNKFNSDFEKSLSEGEKRELKQILTITPKDLKNNVNILKEEISIKINNLMETENNETVLQKLKTVLDETNRIPITKYNYYKLLQLKNGL
jgi:hypothetical protein